MRFLTSLKLYRNNLCTVPSFLTYPNNVNIFRYLKTNYQSNVQKIICPNIKRFTHLMGTQEISEDHCKKDGASTDNKMDEFVCITNNDPTLEKKLKILFLEAEVFRQSGGRVPDHIGVDHWKELFQMDTRSRRRRFLSYLFGVEKKKENKKAKKELKKNAIVEKAPIQERSDHIEYGLGHNTFFLRIYDATITQFHNSRLIQAMRFGQKLVLDCSYDKHMTKQEAMNCGKQIMLMFSDNRLHDSPFDLHLCNADSKSICMTHLTKFIPTLYEPDFPLNISDKSYLDIFPREKIVYLTPHCREVLTEFDHDVVYVIGAMVDKANNEPLSLAKAKRQGLKMAKLPLDNYLSWGSGGSKSLTLNQMMRILLEVRTSGDWNKAFQHIPQRKVANYKKEGNKNIRHTRRY